MDTHRKNIALRSAASSADIKSLERLGKRPLQIIGADVAREGLAETLLRYARFWLDFIINNDEFKFTTFSSENQHEMVAQTHIPFFSLCEHHLIPFFWVRYSCVYS